MENKYSEIDLSLKPVKSKSKSNKMFNQYSGQCFLNKQPLLSKFSILINIWIFQFTIFHPYF